MINNFINKIPKGAWKLLAILIIIITPAKAFIGLELMAMVNLFGAEYFILMYVSGFILLIQPVVYLFIELGRKHLHIPTKEMIQTDKRYLLFMIHGDPVSWVRISLFVTVLLLGVYILAVELIEFANI